ncbi:ABC transporter substrate-binding protein [Janibacter melonis]|uniref:ABC transporter substrate-binding protein n=1 Tax=Janibacter melonis TaxID=262209 RepID=UPI0020946BB8|nr:ABC transporter substrate-binding protein [Janibacter melonis]
MHLGRRRRGGCVGREHDAPRGPGAAAHGALPGPGPVLGPQRITSRQQSAFAGRTYLRTLTTYASATDLAGQKELVGDLATSTGRASKDQTRWSFTLRKGVSWQDGSRITCGDLRYGSPAPSARTPPPPGTR